MRVKLKKIHPDAKIPKYQTRYAAGFDLCSIEDNIIASLQRGVIKTGLAIELQEGYELQIRPRSGLALKYGISVLNSPGTIDSDYRGEIMIILINTSKEDFIIHKGDRIAQGVVAQYVHVDFEVVKNLDNTARGERGFGSSGIRG